MGDIKKFLHVFRRNFSIILIKMKKSKPVLRPVVGRNLLNKSKSFYKIISAVTMVYIGAFYLTSSCYESEVRSLDKEIDNLKEQGKFCWERIGYLQTIFLPVKPDITNPYSIFLSVLSLFSEQRKELSGIHVHRLQKLMQNAEKGALRGIYFKNLALGHKFTSVNGEYFKNSENTLFYIDFRNKNFQESTFEASIFSNLDLTNSIFYKTRLERVLILASRLDNVNMEKASIQNVTFYNSFLLSSNAKDTFILDSIFDNSDLKNTDFTNASITNSSFRETNLQGVNFSNVNFWYNDEQSLRHSFQSARFSSKEIDEKSLFKIHLMDFEEYKKYASYYCTQTAKSQKTEKICITILKHYYYVLWDTVKATIFPEDFDYTDLDMIDISPFFEAIANNVTRRIGIHE